MVYVKKLFISTKQTVATKRFDLIKVRTVVILYLLNSLNFYKTSPTKTICNFFFHIHTSKHTRLVWYTNNEQCAHAISYCHYQSKF